MEIKFAPSQIINKFNDIFTNKKSPGQGQDNYT